MVVHMLKLQTVKEEKVEAIKRVKDLQQQKAKLSKKFREKKDNYGTSKVKLQNDMARYQELLKKAESSGESSKERETELAKLLQDIEKTRECLVHERDILAKIKDKQSEVEDKLVGWQFRSSPQLHR